LEANGTMVMEAHDSWVELLAAVPQCWLPYSMTLFLGQERILYLDIVLVDYLNLDDVLTRSRLDFI